MTPAVVILIRAVRADNKVQGYQIAAYLDKATARLQLITASLAEEDHWRICADGTLLSNHKMMVKISNDKLTGISVVLEIQMIYIFSKAKIAWGIECKQYDTVITAETGLVGQEPAVRLKLTWDRLPANMKSYAKL